MAWITSNSDPCYCSSNYLFCFHEFIQIFMRRDTFSAVNLFHPLNEKKLQLRRKKWPWVPIEAQ